MIVLAVVVWVAGGIVLIAGLLATAVWALRGEDLEGARRRGGAECGHRASRGAFPCEADGRDPRRRRPALRQRAVCEAAPAARSAGPLGR